MYVAVGKVLSFDLQAHSHLHHACISHPPKFMSNDQRSRPEAASSVTWTTFTLSASTGNDLDWLKHTKEPNATHNCSSFTCGTKWPYHTSTHTLNKPKKDAKTCSISLRCRHTLLSFCCWWCTYAGVRVPSDTEAEHQIKDRNYVTDDDMRGRVSCVQILVTMSLSEVTWRTLSVLPVVQ